ncbi:MAG: hypothetical protein HDR03_05680 [Lachnospiraceae bacterium]|nr:hypothetical protein [Lachnospiraceae bacterium]
MEQDIKWKKFLSNKARYADIINGIIYNGNQLINADAIHDNSSLPSSKSRDTIRKTAFGVNFAIIGVENQETIDYSMPLRSMIYDAAEYDKQALRIRKEVRQQHENLSNGEYLYGFKKNSRLYPVVTFILYAGTIDWDGAESLHEILDFTDIPEQLKEKVQDYKINLIEIRKLQNTDVFKTDVRQVFEFIKYSENKEALLKLVESDSYYKNMEPDAFEVAAHYANADALIKIRTYHRKGDKIDMCNALKELIADGRAEGRIEGIRGTITICRNLNITDEIIAQNIQETYNLSEEEAWKFLLT